MVILYSIPVILSSLIISAHFYRNDFVIVSIICLLSPLLLLFRKRWIPKLMTFLLILFTLEWVRTMLSYVDEYKLQERSYNKLVVILLLVILFTLLSSIVFKSKTMKKRYEKDDEYLILNR
jgi:hypothetical protein